MDHIGINMLENLYKISTDFTDTPGARYFSDGDFSGEEFREHILIPFFEKNPDAILTIDLDETYGYPTSFLDEAFGGLARRYGVKFCNDHLRFVSVEEPLLINEIQGYINKNV